MTPEEWRERREFLISMGVWLVVIVGSFVLSWLTAHRHHG